MVEQAAARAPSGHQPRSVRRRHVSARGDAAQRSGQGVRHDHRRLQRVLQLLRRAVHARPRADAAEGATSWPRCARRPTTGHREVQLLGQIVNHYAAPDDPSCDFSGLLEAIHAIDGIERIRFASPHPRHVSPRFLETMARLPKICRHLHLPVQSGSTRVLEAMRRRYTRDSYLDLVARIRESLPDVALSTDMIVGFPGETDADFDDTLTLTAAVRYHSMFSFKYSPRPNTLADKRLADDVRGRGEDAADRRAAGAAAGDSDGAERGDGRADGRRAGGRGQPAARDRAVGPHEHATSSSTCRGRRTGSAGRCRSGSSGPARTASGAGWTDERHRRAEVVERHANRNDHQGVDGRPHHQHADRHPARQGRAEGAADLGRHLRGERHRAADREHRRRRGR